MIRKLFSLVPNFIRTPTILWMSLISFALFMSCSPQNTSYEENWVELFNGKDIKDWKVKITGYPLNENFGNTFRVEDSLLKVSYDQYKDSLKGRWGHIFYKDKFSAYLLVAEYRFYGEQVADGEAWAFMNNGLMLHSQSPESMGLDQDYPISLECQLLGSEDSIQRPNGNVCTPGTHIHREGELITQHCINSNSEPRPGRKWTHVEALVLGDSIIKHIVGRDTVLVYEKPIIGGGVVHNFDPQIKEDGKALQEGYIALQSESFPTAFRKIELFNLEPYMNNPEELQKALEYLRNREDH